MKIQTIQLDYNHKSGFTSAAIDGIRHIKTLPFLSVVQATEGNYDIQLGNGETYNTGSGGFFIATSGVQQTITHHCDQNSRQMVCRWVFLKIKVNDLYDLDALYDFPAILPETHKQEMHLLFDRLFASENPFDEYVCYYEIVRLLSFVAKEKSVQFPLHLNSAISYIKANYQDRITVDDIASEANVSSSHLFSVFREKLGVSPITYLNNFRLSMAADALLTTDQTIVEIANSVGIEDSVYFNKLFRKTYQMSPSKYREIYKVGRG